MTEVVCHRLLCCLVRRNELLFLVILSLQSFYALEDSLQLSCLLYRIPRGLCSPLSLLLLCSLLFVCLLLSSPSFSFFSLTNRTKFVHSMSAVPSPDE